MNFFKLFLLVIAVLLIGIVIFIVRDPGPENWAPFYSFYRSKTCIIEKNDGSTCYLYGIQSPSFGKTIRQNFDELEFFLVFKTQDGFENKLKLKFNAWHCMDFSTQKEIDIDSEIASKGEVFSCWPDSPLPDAFGLCSTLNDNEKKCEVIPEVMELGLVKPDYIRMNCFI